jgi:hypothetical protein
MTANTQLNILNRMIEPDRPTLSPEAARFFLSLDFSESDQQRMEQLSRGSNAGTLSPDEAEELDEYVRVNHLLAFLQSKSRLSLRKHNSAA